MSYVEVNNHKLHYADSHPQGAPEKGLTFVFIHGLGSSQNFYFPVIPYLTSKHRCITLDTYGSARSEYTGQPISIGSIAEDVIAVMDKFLIDQAVVVGHSMGGLVVTLLGAQYEDRIKGVVAIGPTHPSETLVSVMTKRAETVSSCMFPNSPLLFIYKLPQSNANTSQNSRNGTHGQFNPLPSHRILRFRTHQILHPRTPPWPEPQGLCRALSGHRQRS